jgi:Putative Ig domain
LNSTTGVISGTPTGPSTSTIVTTRTYLVVDSTRPTAQVTQKALTISINAMTQGSSSSVGSLTHLSQAPSQPIIKPFSLPNGTVNVAYPNIQLNASDGIPPYMWSVSPSLPNGLFLNLLGPGVISGTPLNASNGPTTHTFKIIDSTVPTGQSSELTRNFTINATLTLDIDPPTGTPLPTASVGQPYNATLLASGGKGPGTYTWSMVGHLLPAPGLQLSAGGILSGTPTTPGTFARTYRVQDSNGAAAIKSLSLTVNSALTIDTDHTTLPLPAGFVGQPYDTALMASGGTGPGTYTWSLASDVGSLPEGLTLNGTGRIVGTPTVTGIFSPTFTVADTTSSAQKRLSITIR